MSKAAPTTSGSCRAVKHGLRARPGGLFGTSARLWASVITRLASQWQTEREAFARRDVSEQDYVYAWAEGIHFNLRLEDGRCVLVLVGVRADGTKELAVADGQRESGDGWAELLTLRDQVIGPSWPVSAAPGWAASPPTGPPSDRDYETLRIGMQTLFADLGIQGSVKVP